MRNIITLLLTLNLFFVSLPLNVIAGSKNSDENKQVQKLKEVLLKFSKAKNTKLKVLTKDGSIIAGTLNQVNDDSFIVRVIDSEEVTIPYPAVAKIQGGTVNKKVTWIWGAAIAVAVVVALAVVIRGTK
jgi:small nuclear ribonucleoprotein (snRNP)-like protein